MILRYIMSWSVWETIKSNDVNIEIGKFLLAPICMITINLTDIFENYFKII